MTKTPDEIKKGLECCQKDECFGERENCPYTADPNLCVGVMCGDVLAFIQQLQAENAEKDERIQQLEADLEDMTARYKIADDCAKKKGEMNEKLYAELTAAKAERDAAVEDLVSYATLKCFACKYYEEELTEVPCNECKILGKGNRDMFEWRGVQKD